MNTALKNKIIPLLFCFILFASAAKAQSFKVIEDKPLYQLQLVDSAYFTSHGNTNKVVPDTSSKNILNKTNQTISLSITNGQPIKFRSVLYPNLSDYIYLGLFKCCGFYLVRAKINFYTIDNYYLINSITGSIDTLTGYPAISPSTGFYAYNAKIQKNTMLEMTIKNLNTGVITNITCPDETEVPSMVYKWENDTTLLFDGLSTEKPGMIYYRVVMKE